MKSILFALILLPATVYAHCPIPLEIHGEHFCTDLTWLPADTKVQGQYQESASLSPYLIPGGEIPQKWMYSKVELSIWKKGDSTHAPQSPQGFRVFPYMVMENGMHHSAGYNFSFNSETQGFAIQHLALQSMKGCWSLRWTTAAEDDVTTSAHLANIVEYTNLNEGDLAKMVNYCDTLSAEEAPADGGHHHH